MRVHVLQHASFEGLGNIETWLQEHDAQITYTRFYESAELPALTGIDLVIALGGSMSVNDESELPWLIPEKRFIAQAIDNGVAVLGICLGAQLIAAAKGSRVYPAPEKEIGWFPISATPHSSGRFNFPAATEVLHWHGETFDLPQGALHLASSEACKNQAFQWGHCVIGLQFHMEMTRASVDAMLKHCASDLVEQRYVQAQEVIRAASDERYAATKRVMSDVLAYITQHRDR
ncbi:type 1 glutamine amidotransferase [Pseudomonas batumici]|uniref:type 1 glutamine amidotransferase n=1 Tax=Pseudomonas batumici TaxID=226910 RepID=UPI0030D2AEC1